METGRPRIALLGGVPASLGGGGLEVQIRRTHEALERAGCDVFNVAAEREPRDFDLLHAFSAEPDVAHSLHHWRRHRDAPLVVSPVIVVAPGLREWTLRASHRTPLPAYGPRERAIVLRAADAVVALTEHEAQLVRSLGGSKVGRVEVIGNGVEPVAEADPQQLAALELPERYVVLLGSVSPRKRQADVLQALAGSDVTPVVIGELDGTMSSRSEWERLVERTGAMWLGEVRDQALVRAVLGRAQALVHLSSAEGQSLAVLEALSAGCPVVVSDLPSHRELLARHPEHVRLVDGPQAVRDAAATLERPASRPDVDSWDDVAGKLLALYNDLLRR